MNPPEPPRNVSLVIEDETVRLTVAHDGEWVVRDHRVGGQECRLRLIPLEPGVYLLQTGGCSCLVHVVEVDERRMLHVGGRTLEYRAEPGSPGNGTSTEPGRPARRGGRAGRSAPQAVGHAGSVLAGSHAGSGLARPSAGLEDLSAPMPGVIARVLVNEGDMVTSGQGLVIVEAMKMEHVVRAGRAGVVRRLYVRQGEQVEGGARIAEIGPAPTGPGAT